MMKAVQRHDGLLPHGILGVGEEVDDGGQDGGDGLLADEAADGVERGANDEVVVGFQVFLDGVDNEDDEVVVVV